MKLYYFCTLKALWDGQGKIKMHYGMSRVKKQLSGKKCIIKYFLKETKNEFIWVKLVIILIFCNEKVPFINFLSKI